YCSLLATESRLPAEALSARVNARIPQRVKDDLAAVSRRRNSGRERARSVLTGLSPTAREASRNRFPVDTRGSRGGDRRHATLCLAGDRDASVVRKPRTSSAVGGAYARCAGLLS